MTHTYDREAWLTEQSSFLLDDVIYPVVLSKGFDLPRPPVRVSVGFPTGRASRAIAVCYKRDVSTDGTNEIFVSPTLDDSHEILAALVHELIHAYDDCRSGHRNFFAAVARAVGLEGPLTHTVAGPALAETLAGYVDLLGPIPHARLDPKKRKRDGTRMLKCECTACGFVFRTSAKWVDAVAHTHGRTAVPCLACASHAVNLAV